MFQGKPHSPDTGFLDKIRVMAADYEAPPREYSAGRMRVSDIRRPGEGRLSERPYTQDELAADIRANGVRQPLAVEHLPAHGGPTAFNGLHRLDAAERAGAFDVPVVVKHRPGDYPPMTARRPSTEAEFNAAYDLEREGGWAGEPGISAQAGSYSMQHTAPNPAADHKPLHYYEGGSPDEHVQIYRAAPPGTESINPGDWISLSSEYAHRHGRHATDSSRDWPVYTASVPQRHVHWDENDPDEHGYNGPVIRHPDVHDEETGEHHDWHAYDEAHPHGLEAWAGASVHLNPEDHAFVHDDDEWESDRADRLMDAARAQGALRGARWRDDLYPAREDAEAHAAARAAPPAGHQVTAFTVHRTDQGDVEGFGVHHYQSSHDPGEWRKYRHIDVEDQGYEHPAVDDVGRTRTASREVTGMQGETPYIPDPGDEDLEAHMRSHHSYPGYLSFGPLAEERKEHEWRHDPNVGPAPSGPDSHQHVLPKGDFSDRWRNFIKEPAFDQQGGSYRTPERAMQHVMDYAGDEDDELAFRPRPPQDDRRHLSSRRDDPTPAPRTAAPVYMQQKLFHVQPDASLNQPGSGRHNPSDPMAGVRRRQEEDPGYVPPPETWDDPEHGNRDEEWGYYQHPGTGKWHCSVCGESHDSPDEVDEHHTSATDWDKEYPRIPAEVHRGMLLHDDGSYGRSHLHAIREDSPDGREGHAREILHHLGDLGMHWTGDEAQARHYAGIGTGGYRPEGNSLNVVVHARKPAREDIETDPDTLRDRNVFGMGYHDDEEIPLREGAGVHVNGVSWKFHDEPDSAWRRHDFGDRPQHTAGRMDENGFHWNHDDDGEVHLAPPYSGQRLFHGTRSILHPGETLTPDEAARHPSHPFENSTGYVHATPHGSEAQYWAEHASPHETHDRMTELGRARTFAPGYNQGHAYPPRVYEVRPSGPVEPDPNGEGQSYRSASPMHVVGQVHPLECYHCQDERAEETEHWPGHPHYEYLKQMNDEDNEDEDDGAWEDEDDRGHEASLQPGPDQVSEREQRGDRWHAYRGQANDHYHRGIIVQLPGHLDSYVHDEAEPREERAEALQRHFADSGEGLGMHWTPHTQVAQRAIWNAADGHESGHGAYAGSHGYDDEDYDDGYDGYDEFGEHEGDGGEGRDPRTEVMFHVRKPGERNRLPQRDQEQHGIGWAHSQDEDEFPLREGSPLRLAGISWKRHDPQHPNEPFEHADFPKPVRHVSSRTPGGTPVTTIPAVVAHFGEEGAVPGVPGHFAFYHGEGNEGGRPRTGELEEHLYGNNHGRPAWDSATDEAIDRARRESTSRPHYHGLLEGIHQGEHDAATIRANEAVEGGADPFYPHARRAELERGHHEQWRGEQTARADHERAVAEHLEDGQAHMHGQDVPFSEMQHHLRSVHGIPHEHLPEHQLPASDYDDPYARDLEEMHEQHHAEHTLPDTGSYRHTPHGQYVTMHWGPRTDFDAESHLVEHHGMDINELRHDEPDLAAVHEQDHAENRDYLDHHLHTVMDPEGHLPQHPHYDGPDADELREGDPEHHFEVRSRDDDGNEHHGIYHAEDEDHAREMHEAAHPYDEEPHHVGQAPVVPPRRQYTMPAEHHGWEPPMGFLQPPSEHGTDSDTAHSWSPSAYVAPPRSAPQLLEHMIEHHGASLSADNTKQPGQSFLIGLHHKFHDGEVPDHGSHPHQHDFPEGHDPVFGSVTATRDHWDMTESGMRLHLRDEHGIADPGEDPGAVHWGEHSGDTQRHVHPDLEREFVRAANPSIPQGDAFIYTPGDHHDPVFGSARALVAHFDGREEGTVRDALTSRVDPVIQAAAALGAWQPESAADLADAARGLPSVFASLHGALYRLAVMTEDLPVHPDTAEALHQAALAARRSEEYAAELVKWLPREDSWDGSPNQ